MQPKKYSLRINLEQVSHLVDGLVENRKNISDSSLALYDSLIEDVFDQFKSQGIQITLEEPEQDPDEVEQAKALLQLIEDKVFDCTDDVAYAEIKQYINELKTVVFG